MEIFEQFMSLFNYPPTSTVSMWVESAGEIELGFEFLMVPDNSSSKNNNCRTRTVGRLFVDSWQTIVYGKYEIAGLYQQLVDIGNSQKLKK